MRSLTTFLLGATVASCASASPSAPSAPSASSAGDAGSPEAAVTTYFRASDTSSSRLLRAAFHPAAPMQWVDETGAPRLLTQLEWWQRADAERDPRAASSRRLEVLDREGPLALIEAVSTWPTHTFDDLLLVVGSPGGWRIVGKLFERLPPGDPPRLDPAAVAADDAAIRAVVAEKIAAHAAYDPALLARSHTPLCLYVALHVRGSAFTISSLSEAAARYAANREAGLSSASPWRVLRVDVRGRIAAVKLDVQHEGRRLIDHLLLLKTSEGWRIAAASWGDPA